MSAEAITQSWRPPPHALCLKFAMRFLGSPRYGPGDESGSGTFRRCCWDARIKWATLPPPLVFLLKNTQPCNINPTPSAWLFLRNWKDFMHSTFTDWIVVEPECRYSALSKNPDLFRCFSSVIQKSQRLAGIGHLWNILDGKKGTWAGSALTSEVCPHPLPSFH